MNSDNVSVFFYGLFMDEALLRSRGIRPTHAATGYVDGYALRIGERATLVPENGSKAHGVVMTLPADEVAALYSAASVADYVAEPVSVVLPDESIQPAVCYNLPVGKLAGANPEYAQALLALAQQLDLPDDYLLQIRNQGRRDRGPG